VRCDEGYGAAVRDYAFAARSGRLSVTNLNSNYLGQCESEITNRALDVMTWSSNNAYGTSLDPASKGHDTSQYLVGYYFAGDRVFDLAVADRIHADPAHIAAMIENFNYEAGRNPVNTCFITGLGSQRQREIVDQFAQNNPLAVLPPSGIPLGNICDDFYEPGGWPYEPLSVYYFPPLGTGTNTFGLYDRWAQTYNLHTEFVHPQTARSFVAAAVLANLTSLSTQAWQSANATIQFVTGAPTLNAPGLAKVVCTNVDLSQAQITWDPGRSAWNGLGQDPTFGSNYVFLPAAAGQFRTLQAEATLPDGRRIFATNSFSVYGLGTSYSTDSNTVALYHFDTALVADSSGNSNTLFITTNTAGGVVLTNNTTWMENPTGYVARFNGPGNCLSNVIPTGLFPTTNYGGGTIPAALSIEAWIYPRSYAASSQMNIVYFGPGFYGTSCTPSTVVTNWGAMQWGLQYNTGQIPDAPEVLANQAVLLSNAQWNEVATLNTWHLLQITFDGVAQISKVYVDGVLQCCSACMPQPGVGNYVLTLGNFNGDIDEVRLSNIVRTNITPCPCTQ